MALYINHHALAAGIHYALYQTSHNYLRIVHHGILFIKAFQKQIQPLKEAGGEFLFSFLFAWVVFVFLWNNGLREAVVTEAFLFLSTFFIQSAKPILSCQMKPVNMFMYIFAGRFDKRIAANQNACVLIVDEAPRFSQLKGLKMATLWEQVLNAKRNAVFMWATRNGNLYCFKIFRRRLRYVYEKKPGKAILEVWLQSRFHDQQIVVRV